MMARKIVYTRTLGRDVAKGARIKRARRFHVVSSFSNNGWSVVVEGSVRALRAFPTKRAAVSYAKREAAPKSIEEVIIHEKDGKIQNVIAI